MFRARTALATKTVSEVETAHYQAVAVAGPLPEGRAEVADLAVIVDAAGLSVVGPTPGVTRTVRWDRVSSLVTCPATMVPNRPATALRVAMGVRSVDLLFASDAYGEEAIAELIRHTSLVSGMVITSSPVAVVDVPAPASVAAPTAAEVATDAPAGEAAAVAAGPDADEPARARRRTLRVGLLTIAVVLVAAGTEGWFVTHRTTPSAKAKAPVISPAVTLARNTTLAAGVGIQPAELAGWTSGPGNAGNPFASGANSSAAATTAATTAASDLAQCLKVPVFDVDGAFGIGADSGRVATAQSLVFSDASVAGNAASSAVSVMGSSADVAGDLAVFANSALFTSCYQSYAQAMAPYVAGPQAGTTFSTATVQGDLVPQPSASAVHVAAVQISRIANVSGQAVTVNTDAIAVFGGRVQATLTTTSNSVFDQSTENSLVSAAEAKVAGDVNR